MAKKYIASGPLAPVFGFGLLLDPAPRSSSALWLWSWLWLVVVAWWQWTSCAIRGARGRGIGRRSAPPGGPPSGSRGELGPRLGVVQGPTWPLAPGLLEPVRWPVTPTGTGHRDWLLFPSSVPAAAGRPGAEAARVLGSWAAAALSTGFGNGAAPHCWHCVYPDRRRPPPSPCFFKPFSQSDQILC
jgi:hypothetical protein